MPGALILTATFAGAATPLALPDCAALLARAEAAGFDAAFFTRSPGRMLDALPLIAALAHAPGAIGLGASVPAGYSEPFHVARSYAAIDRLTRGRSALVVDMGLDLAPALGRGQSGGTDRLLEFFDATRGLWDSWQDDAVIVDRAAGLFTDPDKIHRINHDGPFYAVRGPLNAPRPLQGWPVTVFPADAPPALAARLADIVLVDTPDAAAEIRRLAGPRTIKILLNVAAPAIGPGLPAGCDGFNLVRPDLAVAIRPPAPATGTLRDRLGLPRPVSRYAA